MPNFSSKRQEKLDYTGIKDMIGRTLNDHLKYFLWKK